MIPLAHLLIVFITLVLVGSGLTLPLYRFNLRRFVKSAVFIKIVFWIPIFVVFLGLLYARNPMRLGAMLIILVVCLIELLRSTKTRLKYLVYFLLFSAGLCHFILLANAYQKDFTNLLISLAFATVLSDVTAYFLGNYAGKHKLPAWLNPAKSWEGVGGEIFGGLLGLAIVNLFVEPVLSLWLFIPIGLGSAIGDLSNSYFKRQAGLKDWSRVIPGHGGFIDRLSSLAGSAMLTFYFLKITNLG